MKVGSFANSRQDGAFAESLSPPGDQILARTYAVVMALLAMLVVLLRAMKNGAGVEGTIANAFAWMGLLGVVGLVVGLIAQATVDQSVLSTVQAELASTSSSDPDVQPADAN